MFLEWSDKYNIGVVKIDEQHRELFALVNSLSELDKESMDAEVMKQALDFLVKYAVQHFKDEEEVQLAYEYPGYKTHRQMHENFKTTLGVMVELFMQEFTVELLNSLRKILYLWLKSHVANVDNKIGEYIRKISASKN
jgi:hemerythrin